MIAGQTIRRWTARTSSRLGQTSCKKTGVPSSATPAKLTMKNLEAQQNKDVDLWMVDEKSSSAPLCLKSTKVKAW